MVFNLFLVSIFVLILNSYESKIINNKNIIDDLFGDSLDEENDVEWIEDDINIDEEEDYDDLGDLLIDIFDFELKNRTQVRKRNKQGLQAN